MKFKKILSVFAAVTMVFSTFSFTYAADTNGGNEPVINERFSSYSSNFLWGNSADVALDQTVSRSEDGTGALKVNITGASSKVLHYVYNAAGNGLEEGETYLYKAYVCGGRIKNGTTNLSISYEYDDIVGEGKFYNPQTVSISAGKWQEISMYFVAGAKTTQYYSIWNKRINLEFTDATAGTAEDNTCDIFYVDDITVEKVSGANVFFENTAGKKNKFSKFDSTELKYAFGALDITKTKNVLMPGETTGVIAYLQDGAKGTMSGNVTRTAADTAHITAVSSDETVASYADGAITANGSGNAVITYTYNDGTTSATAKQLITVSSNTANIVDTKYATVKNPLDPTEVAKTAVSGNNVDLGIAGNIPAVVSYRIYFNGRNTVNLGYDHDNYCLGRTAVLFSGKYTESADVHGERYQPETERMSHFKIDKEEYPGGGKRNLPIDSGWNNIDFVTEYPRQNSYDDGYMRVTLYVNGNVGNSAELKLSNPGSNLLFLSDYSGSSIIDDLTVVSMKEPLKVKSTNPANGEKLSTLDDIDIEFNQAPSISDFANSAELFYGQKKIETVNTFHSEKLTLSVRPVNGLKPNLKYTLKLNRKLIKTNSGEELAGDNEFSFTTDSVKVSDVIGSGYTLLNSQYDMIRNGSYKVNGKGEMITERDGSLALRLPNEPDNNKNNSVSVSAEKSFLTTTDAEKIIVEFDTKVETPEENPNNYEYAVWSVNGINADSQVGTLTQLGQARWGASRAFNVLWSYLTVDPKTGAKIVANPKNEQGDEYGIYFADANFKLDNKGYAHVKIVYDLNQKDPEGDVAQTIYMTCGGKEYQYKTDKSTITFKYNQDGTKEIINDITSIAGISLSMNQVTVDRTAYLKNVNMYAVKLDPDSVPNAEITLSDLLDDDLVPITTAEGLKGKVYFKASLTNNKLDENQSYAIIVAAYDKDTNKLIDMKYKSGTVPTGTTVVFEGSEIDNTALDLTGHTSGTAVIKVFAWNSLDGAMPLVDAYTHQF